MFSTFCTMTFSMFCTLLGAFTEGHKLSCIFLYFYRSVAVSVHSGLMQPHLYICTTAWWCLVLTLPYILTPYRKYGVSTLPILTNQNTAFLEEKINEWKVNDGALYKVSETTQTIPTEQKNSIWQKFSNATQVLLNCSESLIVISWPS